jgi:predicted ester cyclase
MEGRVVRSPEDFLEARRELLTALPDISVEVQAVVAEGDQVAVRWAAKATGPTGPVSFRGMSWLVFDRGRIVRGWDAWNQALLLQQLALPLASTMDPGRSQSAGP